MPEAHAILARVRELGADIVLDGEAMKIVRGKKLTDETRQWLAQHRDQIERYLRRPSTDAGETPWDDDTPPRTWGQFARILHANVPEGVEHVDWSWFITTAGKIVRGEVDA